MIYERLEKSIIQSAMQGELTEQFSTDNSILSFVNQSDLNKIKIEDQPWEIPENWGWIKFSDLVKFDLGKTPQRSNTTFWGNDVPWVSIADMYNQPILSKTKEKVSIKGFDEVFANKIVPRGTLLMSFKLTVGRVSILDIDALHNEAIISIYPNKHEDIQKQYLFYVLPIISNLGDTKDAIKGKTLNRKSLSNLLIPLPPVEEQLRIVNKLEEIYPVLNELEKHENDLKILLDNFPERFKASLLKTLISGNYTSEEEFIEYEIEDLDTVFNIPKSWKISSINEVATLMTGNSIPVAVKKSKYSNLDDGYYYIATKDVGFDSVIDYDNGIRIPHDEPKFKVAKKDNILLCIEGGSAGRKIGLLDKDVTFGNKLCSFEPKYIDSKYLYYFIQSPLFQTQFKNSMTGMIGGVGITKLRNFKIVVPSIEEQKLIVEKIEEILKVF